MTLNSWPIFGRLEETNDWFAIRIGLGFEIYNQYHPVWREKEQTLAIKSKLVAHSLRGLELSYINSIKLLDTALLSSNMRALALILKKEFENTSIKSAK